MGTSYQAGLRTRQLILDVSKKLFYSKGYIKTTYTDISEAADMNRGLIPYHFKNKQTLGFSVCMDIINNTLQAVSDMLDTDSLSDDLVAALNIVSFYKLLSNRSFNALLLDVINDNGNSIFDINNEKNNIIMLGSNMKKLEEPNLELISHVSAALKKEAVIYYSDHNSSCSTKDFAMIHIQTVMNYAGYSKKSILELTEPATQLAGLLSYDIGEDFSVNITYK